jgi:cytoskeletal protein CcmA (bactofilin family)
MSWKLLVVLSVLLFALAPTSALAQQERERGGSDDILLRINGPIELGTGDSAGTVISVSDDARIAGTIEDGLVVIDGTATITGTIDGDVLVMSGELNLGETARITGDLNLYDSDLTRAGGAVVEGSIHERSAFTWSAWDTFVISAFFWAALTMLSMATALLFAAAGGRQLVTAASYLTERPTAAMLAALVGGVLLPLAAIAAFLTLFGIPIGIAVLLLLMPIMLVLGFITVGTRIGLMIVARDTPLEEIEHPYLAAVAGVVILHTIGLIPFVGGLIQVLAAIFGAGALTLLAWEAWRGPGAVEQVGAAPLQEHPAPIS